MLPPDVLLTYAKIISILFAVDFQSTEWLRAEWKHRTVYKACSVWATNENVTSKRYERSVPNGKRKKIRNLSSAYWMTSSPIWLRLWLRLLVTEYVTEVTWSFACKVERRTLQTTHHLYTTVTVVFHITKPHIREH